MKTRIKEINEKISIFIIYSEKGTIQSRVYACTLQLIAFYRWIAARTHICSSYNVTEDTIPFLVLRLLAVFVTVLNRRQSCLRRLSWANSFEMLKLSYQMNNRLQCFEFEINVNNTG